MPSCVCNVASWMQSNCLQLNTSKSEVLWYSSVRRQHLIPDTSLIVGIDAVLPACSVRNLSIYIDSDVSMRINVAKTASSCFCSLHQIRSIRTVSKYVLLSLVVAMVLARLDYGSTTLAVPTKICYLANFSLCSTLPRDWSSLVVMYDHVTLLLRDLQWLPFLECIMCRLAVLANMVCHCLICQSIFTASQMLTPVREFDPHRRQGCSFHARLSTVGDRAFAVAAARAWNNLPPSVTSAPSLPTFRKRLKPNFYLTVFALTVYMPTHVLFYMLLIYVYFLCKRLCGPRYRACIVPLQLNLAYVTLICSLTN